MAYSDASSAVPGAVLPDGRLNVSLLQREIESDLSNDARYRAEDGMKKKAIHMSKNYDEFRNFVSASQLKPVGRSDLADLFSGSVGGGKRAATRVGPSRKDNKSFSKIGGDGAAKKGGTRRRRERWGDGHFGAAAVSSSSANSRGRAAKSATPAAFEKEWRRKGCASSPSAALRLLGSSSWLVPEEAPSTVFRVEIDADILGGMIGALGYLVETKRRKQVGAADSGDDDAMVEAQASLSELCFAPKKDVDDCAIPIIDPEATFIYRWMNALPQCGRFRLNVAFLTEEQKEQIENICTFLEERVSDNHKDRDTNAKEESFTQEDVEQIRGEYLQ